MTPTLARTIFVALCAIGFFTIGGSAFFEWGRFRRGASLLSARHFRLRLLSAFIWLLVLGSLAFATIFLWPQHAGVKLTPIEQEMARRFVIVSSGAMLLLFVALGLMALDVFWTIQVGRRNAVRRTQSMDEMAQREIQRSKQNQNIK